MADHKNLRELIELWNESVSERTSLYDTEVMVEVKPGIFHYVIGGYVVCYEKVTIVMIIEGGTDNE